MGAATLLTAGLVLGGMTGTATAADGNRSAPVEAAPTAAAEKGNPKGEQGDTLGARDEKLLAKAENRGAKRVQLIVMAQRGQTGAVAGTVKALGGFVGMTNDKVGYLRAVVPTDKVRDLATTDAVLAIDLNEVLNAPEPPERATAAAVQQSGPSSSTPDANPFMPTRETRSTAFKKAHPTWDGRGVTIGVIDSGVSLDHPALAKTTTGERKIVDWVTATDPIFDGDLTWRPMITAVSGPTFTAASATWTTPRAGDFMFDRFSEAITAGSDADGDVNRDGDTSDRFGILYDETTHEIWVDDDQDRTFEDDEKIAPYKESKTYHYFGTDDPSTAIQEAVPFTVEYREDVDMSPYGIQGTADFVNIGIDESSHGTHVAGIAAGNGLLGGSMDGQAPGAKVVSSRACSWGGGCTAVALSDGMVDLVANKGVDVVNMSIGGLPALNDGNNARARLYDELIKGYGVQLFISAGNSGAGMNTMGDPSVATDVVSVGSSISKETWMSNYGSAVSAPMNLHNFSSRGPLENGAFKPNIVAPGSAISSIPTWQPGDVPAEAGYSLPPGYAMFNGTSMASPQAAGGAALLLSAAKASRMSITPTQLRASIYDSAHQVAGVKTYEQGAGLMDVPAAWSRLAKRPGVRSYSSRAYVCTALASYLATPSRGPGLYNRCPVGQGGQKVGEARRYNVYLKRNTGPWAATTHTIRLVGNDGTFNAPTSVTLARGQEKTIKVTVKPRYSGARSAIMVVDDAKTMSTDLRVPLTVVAPRSMPAPTYRQATKTSVERNRYKSVFVTVPQGTKNLSVRMSGIASGSQTRWIANNPYGIPVESTSSLLCFSNFSDASKCDPYFRNYADPIPGVWEFVVESRRTTPDLTNPFRLDINAQGVSVTPPTQTLASVTAGQPTTVTWDVKNGFGPVTAKAVGGPLGSALSERTTIANHETQEFTVEVPAGASELTATIGNPSDQGADLDLTVYDENGAQVGQSADGDSEESVTIPNPAAGTYTVEVDGYEVPSGSTEYDYLDVFTSPELGSLTVTDPAGSFTLDAGATRTVTGEITATQAPAAGRKLFGAMEVQNVPPAGSEPGVLGRGEVIITAVN